MFAKTRAFLKLAKVVGLLSVKYDYEIEDKELLSSIAKLCFTMKADDIVNMIVRSKELVEVNRLTTEK